MCLQHFSGIHPQSHKYPLHGGAKGKGMDGFTPFSRIHPLVIMNVCAIFHGTRSIDFILCLFRVALFYNRMSKLEGKEVYFASPPSSSSKS